jgi:hypothetical protein
VTEKWITYKAKAFSAKELTVHPGGSVTIPDRDAYGLIAIGGFGTLNNHRLEATNSLRFGQLSADEYFVSEPAALSGVTVSNLSPTEDLVILKHFGPENEQLGEESPVLGISQG